MLPVPHNNSSNPCNIMSSILILNFIFNSRCSTSLLSMQQLKIQDFFSLLVGAQHDNIAAVKASTTAHRRSGLIDPQSTHSVSVGFSISLW